MTDEALSDDDESLGLTRGTSDDDSESEGSTTKGTSPSEPPPAQTAPQDRDLEHLYKNVAPFRRLEPTPNNTQTYAVHAFMRTQTATAEYKGAEKHYRHDAKLAMKQPFVVEHLIVPDGSLQGMEVLVLKPVLPFPFQSLPLELRVAVYRLVFGEEKKIAIERAHRRFFSLNFQEKNHLAILSVNKQIYDEAIEELFRGRTFLFSCSFSLASFISRFRATTDRIKSIKLNWSSVTNGHRRMRCLASCPSLTSLCVKIEIPKSEEWDDECRKEKGRELAMGLRSYLKRGGSKGSVNINRFKALKIEVAREGLGSRRYWRGLPTTVPWDEEHEEDFKAMIEAEL